MRWAVVLVLLGLLLAGCAGGADRDGKVTGPGFLEPISRAMVVVIQQLESLTHNLGLAIVLFAVLIKVILYYPTQQQYKSMKVMQKLQPELERIRESFKEDPQRMQEEQMKLFRAHNVNPLGGCLPMLIQMPILVAIWRAILSEQELFESAYFLWIHPGPLHSRFPDLVASSLAGRDLSMILFYGLTMYLSQRLTPVQSTQPGTQKMMAIGMTVFFTWLMWVYKWPCALILYWSVFSLLTIVQQSIIIRTPEEPQAPAPAA